jgi:F0F1-type ATP synthase membrane subunit b/b'
MLKRNDYLQLIEEIRNTELKSLDEFIEKEIEPLRAENGNLIETLYKDIHYLLKDIDKKTEGNLEIENGDFVIEDGDLKLTGYQSRLHHLLFWLHAEVINKFIRENPFSIAEKMESFEKSFLEKPNYTPEYKAQLNKIKKSLRKERKQNLNDNGNFWNKILDIDNLELKPNIAGIGINFNEIVNKFR